MGVESVIGQLESSLGAKRIFSEPIEKDGATIILAARVRGGGGGGEGQGQAPNASGQSGAGTGLGFGLMAKPAGAFVISQGRVRWQPAFDLNRALLGGQIVAMTAFLFLRAWARMRTRQLSIRKGWFGRRLRLA